MTESSTGRKWRCHWSRRTLMLLVPIACGGGPAGGERNGVVVAGHSGIVLAESIGIESLGGVTTIFPRGTGLPASYLNIFSTQKDRQDAVELRLRGEESEAGSRALGRFTVRNIPPAEHGTANIRVRFAIDSTGTLTITATVLDRLHTDSMTIPGLHVARRGS
ncbi:MAG: Hsp70 family protein [Gemmatimonadota bacterium]|nr:Hsp70 family protein [Gemmatimonadota bacterium]